MKPENKRIGLIGVGLLGGAIAERLLQHGFVVSGFDLDRGRLDALDAMGGKACRDADDVFTACKTVLLSLPTSEIVCELLSQDVTGVSGSLTIVDTTTGGRSWWLFNFVKFYRRFFIVGNLDDFR